MADNLTAEQLLISALINSQDVRSGLSFGLTPDYIEGFRAEYNWLLNYEEQYGSQPSKEIFLAAFPDFRMGEHEDVRSAVDMVFKAFGRRRMTASMTAAFDLLAAGDLELAWSELQTAEPRRTNRKPKRLLTDMDFLDNWNAPLSAVELPYPTLHRHTKGIQPGNLWYLAARPGQGKTAHLCNIVKHAVMAGNRVRFFSLEMSEDEVRARFHAALATQLKVDGITLDTLRERSVDMHVYKTFVGELDDFLRGTGGFIDIQTPRDGACTPGAVASGADEYHLNVIDYVGLMKADSGGAAVDDWRLQAKISNSLKEIGLASATGILGAAQINREGEVGTAPPKVKNLSQSDALGQDGDVVVTLRGMPHNVATAWSLEKNRHGASGIPFFTTFDPNKGIYREITGDQADSLVIEKEALQ